jgi:ubiquitin-protein ligase
MNSSFEILQKEFSEINSLNDLGFVVELSEPNNLFEWNITLKGAKDTSYSDGIFLLKMKFPYDYPNNPPLVISLTPIYHINVNPKKTIDQDNEPLGKVCFSTLNWWKPLKYNAKRILIDLYSLFYWPNPYSGYGIDRMEECKNNRALYEKKVKYFTNKYANFFNFINRVKFDDKDWDFSYNDNNSQKEESNLNNNLIKVNFIINGKEEKLICQDNFLVKTIIENLGIVNLEESRLLLIYDKKKVNINISLKENGIINNSNIYVIKDVVFA